MSSMSISSQCLRAHHSSPISTSAALPRRPHSFTSPSSSSSWCGFFVARKVPLGENHGLLWWSSRGLQVEEDRKFISFSSRRSCALGSVPSCRCCCGKSGGSRGRAVGAAGLSRRVLDDGEGDYYVTSAGGQQQGQKLVGIISACIVLLGFVNYGSAFDIAAADEGQTPGSTTSTEAAKTGLVERLLERSKANKAKNDQQRLDDYYRRNYRDYFNFLKGNIENKDKDKLTEAEAGILQWLEKNK